MTSFPQPPPDRSEQLERLVQRALREVPARRAPHSLEGRVLAEIARRAALPWWRRSFAHWPLVARGLFLAFSSAIVGITLVPGLWLEVGWENLSAGAAFAEPLAWVDGVLAIGRALRDFGEVAFRAIPPFWLYGAAAFVGALYVAFVGLGTAACKVLYAQR